VQRTRIFDKKQDKHKRQHELAQVAVIRLERTTHVPHPSLSLTLQFRHAPPALAERRVPWRARTTQPHSSQGVSLSPHMAMPICAHFRSRADTSGPTYSCHRQEQAAKNRENVQDHRCRMYRQASIGGTRDCILRRVARAL